MKKNVDELDISSVVGQGTTITMTTFFADGKGGAQ